MSITKNSQVTFEAVGYSASMVVMRYCGKHLISALSAFTFWLCLSPLIISAAHAIEAEVENSNPHVDLPDIPAERKELFVQALLKDEVLRVPSDKIDPISDPKLELVWQGNRPEIEASLADILLEFVKTEDSGRSSAFALSVRFDGDYLYVRHSRPASRQFTGGIRIGLRGNKPRKHLLQGYGVSGVVVAAPPMEELGLRGALICPQDFFRENQVIKSPVLIDTKYRVRSVQLRAGGHASGRVLTSSQIGFARASIATSRRIPNSPSFFDVSYSKDPAVGVTYLANETAQILPVESGNRFLEGIQVSLEMQTAAGYRRDINLSESLLVEPFERDINFPISFLKRSFIVSARSCVLLLQQRVNHIKYSKSPFKTPDGMKLAPVP